MKISRFIVLGLSEVALIVGLAGCIVSASPDTNQEIVMRPGETKVFKVYGLSPISLCEWYIDRGDDDPSWEYGTNSFVFTVNPGGEKSNRVRIVATYSILLYTDQGYYWAWTWVPVDYREWSIRIPRDTAPVWDGDYYIETSADIENLNGYTDITGNLRIIGSDLKYMSGLENLSSIGGDLSFSGNESLTTLAGLENITSVGGSMWFYDNPALTSLAALGNITSLGGDISFYYNSALTNLTGLENITSVGGELYIRDNRALTSLTGLENITSIGGDLTIYYNPALASLAALGNVTSVGGDLIIRDFHQNLTSLRGLENITSVGGDLMISYNDVLTTLGMAALQNVGSDFSISYNPKLCASLAKELRDQVLSRGGIGGTVSIKNNKECTAPL
ncbi:MAG TPA: hypothetical protein VIS94_03210 [Desulfomonilia bacterium]